MPHMRYASLPKIGAAIALLLLLVTVTSASLIASADAKNTRPVYSPAAPDEISTSITKARSSATVPTYVAEVMPPSVFAWLDEHDWSVEWLQGPGPGRAAEARYATRTIVIWESADRLPEFWIGAFAHELGHAVSFTHFTRTKMTEWTQLRGLSSWSWMPGMPNDFAVGEGDFAEAFMGYLLGHRVRSAGGALTPQISDWIAANTPF